MKNDNLTSSFLVLREKLHRSAIRFLKNDEDAKDVVQESYLRLWRKGDIGSNKEIQNKLFTILRNLCIDRLRKTSFLSLSEIKTDEISINPDYSPDIKEFEELMTSGLTGFQKQIYISFTKEDKEYDEIASDFNISEDAVRMNISRIRKKIRENIKKFKL